MKNLRLILTTSELRSLSRKISANSNAALSDIAPVLSGNQSSTSFETKDKKQDDGFTDV